MTLSFWYQTGEKKAVAPSQLILIVATVAVVPVVDDDNVDNTAAIIDICYIAVFAFDECIVHVFECIACYLLASMMENNDNIDNDNDEEEVEEMEEEL